MNTAELSSETGGEPLIQLCGECGAAIDISDEEPLAQMSCPACGAIQFVSGQVGKFELQEVAGRGGMGVVYKAYDGDLDRFVALKLMRRDKSNPTVVAQMEKEAAITASINHPHVVRVFTSGVDHGRFFIAMELVDKGTLDDLIHLQGRVAETQVLEVGIQIAQGLRAAQQAGLIHRDVKPGNILFADAHTSKIVDFGLAMPAGDLNSGEVWGTPYYVAPEKLDRRPEDFRSDMYSLGGTLFHALAGRPPFEAEDASMVALKHLKSQSVSLQAFAPHVSGETAYVINRTLSKDPDDRYQSYDELIEHLGYALEKLQAQGGQPQERKRVVLEGEEQQQAMGWLTAAMFGLIVLIGIGLFIFRDKIFADREGSTPAAGSSVGPIPAARRALLSGDITNAIDLLHQAGKDSKLPPLEQAWANFGEGLARLMAGDIKTAKAPFEAVVNRPQFKSKGEDEKIDFFLRDLAGQMITPNTIPASVGSSMNQTNYETFGIFAYGVKDWAINKPDDAGKLLRQFRNTTPAGSAAWIGELKPLASTLLEDQAAFEMAAERMKAAKRPEQRAKALADLRKVKGPFIPLVAQLERTIPAPKPLVLPKFGEWSTVELGTPDVVPEVKADGPGDYTIKAGGADLWGNADSGVFLYRSLTGDGDLVAHVASISKADALSKVALMIRDSTKPESRAVGIALSVTAGVSQQIRAKSNSATTSVKASESVTGPPRWLKLERKGDTITGFHSSDGKDWTQVAVQKLDKIPSTAVIGIAAAAHSASQATTVKLDVVLFTPSK